MSAQSATILALLAGPLLDEQGRPLARLDMERECRQLQERLGEIERAATLYVELATPESILRLLLRQSFDLLHFSGHGGSGELAFEDDSGGLFPLDGATLQKLIAPGGKAPFRLAFLSACHSASVAPALVEAGIAHVIAVEAQAGVLDAAATAFARNFYPALLAGHSVAQAFQIGRAGVAADVRLRQAGMALGQPDLAALEEAKFLLLPAESDHDVALFPDLPPGHLRLVRPAPSPNNLPRRPETFTGRSRQLHDLLQHLLRHPLVELTGMGGMGKTELAREAGRWLAERGRFPAGIHFIDLRQVADTTTARLRIAADLGLDPAVSRQDDLLTAALRADDTDRRLLILDDLDALVASDRLGLRALLRALHDAGVRVLWTTRERVGSLPAQRCELGRLDEPEDEHLFLHWAGLVRPDLEGEWADLRAVLRFLDRWPLAIVLAAPHLAGSSLAGLREQLEQAQEEVLADPDLSTEERDKLGSVAVSLELSLRRLREREPAAADFFPLLALFPGGADPPALAAITGPQWERAVPALRALSLVEELPGERLRLPEPARARAERALPPDARERYGPAALAYYHQLAAEADSLLAGPHFAAGASRLAQELPNLHFWLDWGYEHEPAAEVCLSARLTAALRNFYMLLAWPAEAQENFGRALAAARRVGDRLGEANVLQAQGDVLYFLKQTDEALQRYDQALQLFRQVGARLGEANVLQAQGDVLAFLDRRDEALQRYDQALQLFRQVGDRLGEANAHFSLGRLWLGGDIRRAMAELERAAELYRQSGAQAGLANVRILLARLAAAQGDYRAAVEQIQPAIDFTRRIGHPLAAALAAEQAEWQRRAKAEKDRKF